MGDLCGVLDIPQDLLGKVVAHHHPSESVLVPA